MTPGTGQREPAREVNSLGQVPWMIPRVGRQEAEPSGARHFSNAFEREAGEAGPGERAAGGDERVSLHVPQGRHSPASPSDTAIRSPPPPSRCTQRPQKAPNLPPGFLLW